MTTKHLRWDKVPVGAECMWRDEENNRTWVEYKLPHDFELGTCFPNVGGFWFKHFGDIARAKNPYDAAFVHCNKPTDIVEVSCV